MKKYTKRSKILSIIFLTLLLPLPMTPAKAFIFENYWKDGIAAWCEVGCGSTYYWYVRNMSKHEHYYCNGAEYGCGSKNGAAIRIKFVNKNSWICEEIDIGKVPANGRMRLLPEQVLIFKTEKDDRPYRVENLTGPGFLCK